MSLDSGKHWLILFVVSAVLGSWWIVASRDLSADIPPSQPQTAPITNHPLPPFQLTTYDGNELNSDNLIGQPILLNFWATWCGPCRAEMPALQTISEEFAGRAHIVGINQAESSAQVAPFANEFSLTYPLLLDENQAINRAYAVRALPTTYFIDANGIIREILYGTASEAVLATKLEALFD